MKIVSSIQNLDIKNLLTLQKKSRERKKKKLFVVEGKKEIERALLGNYYFKIIHVLETNVILGRLMLCILDIIFTVFFTSVLLIL